MEVVKSS